MERDKKYRTRPEDAEKNLPSVIATITLGDYVNALSISSTGMARLINLNAGGTELLEERNGSLYIKDDANAVPMVESQIKAIEGRSHVKDIDLGPLRLFYSIILQDYEANGYRDITNKKTVIYLPDLFGAMGTDRYRGEQQIEALLSDILRYNNLYGVITDGNKRPIYYKLINLEVYDSGRNTITLSSPYISHIVQTVIEASKRKDKNGKALLTTGGKPQFYPSHAYLIKTSIYKQRNKAAIENVNIIVGIIARAGNHLANVTAATLVNRNAFLREELEGADSKHRQQVLNRVFRKTWELLWTETYLSDIYDGICLKCKDEIPKYKNLRNEKFEFPHKGKRTHQNEVW